MPDDSTSGERSGRLCEPYLLDPHPGGVHVVWHTGTPGTVHAVLTGEAVPELVGVGAVAAATGGPDTGPGWRRHRAATLRLTRMREDAASRVPGRTFPGTVARPVHRHLATVAGLPPGRTPYRVVSVDERGRAAVSAAYTLAPAVPAGRPVRLLLTSDHQLAPMVPANLAAVAGTAGVELDGVLAAGDFGNVPDRASDWFDCANGRAFFALFTGRGRHEIAGRTYRGAPILPHTPVYPSIGNHEVMGRWSDTSALDEQFHDTKPRHIDPAGWDVTSYEELFPYPRSGEGGPRWWARTIGEVHVTSLFVTQIWRHPGAVSRGRFREAEADLAYPERWGHGQHLYEPIHSGSRQYRWLAEVLASPEARRARYRVVMFHHAVHGLGAHTSPPYTDPVQTVTRDPGSGAVTAVTYHYPRAADHLLRDLEPLLSRTGVNLVLSGHSHLWNRFRNDAGVNWLETSNVGNTFGAYDGSSGAARDLPTIRTTCRRGIRVGWRRCSPRWRR